MEYNFSKNKASLMYQRQQNTLYPKVADFAEQFPEASDWFTTYNRGKVADVNKA